MNKKLSTLLFLAMAAVGALFAVHFAHKDARATVLTHVTTETGWRISAELSPDNKKLRCEIARVGVPADASAVPLPPYPVRVLVKETGEHFQIAQSPSELLIADVPAGTTRLNVAFPQFTDPQTDAPLTLCVPVNPSPQP
ncbi:MAG: hypothetical protein K6B46_00875 [Opitutales bacterium]|nr:hypothetical protein [Opitutales bacterium]